MSSLYDLVSSQVHESGFINRGCLILRVDSESVRADGKSPLSHHALSFFGQDRRKILTAYPRAMINEAVILRNFITRALISGDIVWP